VGVHLHESQRDVVPASSQYRSNECDLLMALSSLMFGLLRRYVLEFEKCLDKTEPVSWEVIRGRMRNELGRPLEDVFSSVDPVPLASASVAQVHAAGEEQAGTCRHMALSPNRVV